MASAYYKSFEVIRIDSAGAQTPLASDTLNAYNVTAASSLGTVSTDADGVVAEGSFAASAGDVVRFSHGAYPGTVQFTLAATQAEAYTHPDNLGILFAVEDLQTEETTTRTGFVFLVDDDQPDLAPQFIGRVTAGEINYLPYSPVAAMPNARVIVVSQSDALQLTTSNKYDAESASVAIPGESTFTMAPANTLFAGPVSGPDDYPTFRTMVTADLPNSVVTLAKIANIADQTILGNNAGLAGPPIALTASQGRTVLGLGTMATQDASSVAITGGNLTNVDVQVTRTGLGILTHNLGGFGNYLYLRSNDNGGSNVNLDFHLHGTDRTIDLSGNLTVSSGGATVSGTNTGDQTITLTGDVTGSGTGSFATTIAAAAVTLAKMANLAANSFIGNNTGSAATPIAMTVSQSRALLGLATTDAVTFGDLTVSNLTVNGTVTTVNSATITVDDPLIRLADNNGADSLDIGLYGPYVSSGTKYTGVFRDASDGKYKFFTGLTVEPTTTVNIAGSGYTVATLVAHLEDSATNISGGNITGVLGSFTFLNGGLYLKDDVNDNTLQIVLNEDNTADRVLNLYVLDGNRNLSLAGNLTVNANISLPAIVQGDVLYGSASGVLSALAKNTTAQRVLTNGGTSNNPSWAQVDLTTGVTATLPTANGGTNATSFGTTNGVVTYDGTRLITTSGYTFTSSTLTIPGGITLTGSGGTNRTINYGANFGASALTLYDGGSTNRWGWGIQNSNMQFYGPGTGTNHVSFNKGGDLQSAGTNEVFAIDLNTGYISAGAGGGALPINCNINLIPSGGGGSGTNRTINYGANYGNPAIYFYDGGAGSRGGFGYIASEMQLFIPTGDHYSWNKGGGLNTSGTNELMRLDGSTGNLSLGTTSASAKLHVVSTTEQFRPAYDSSNYATFTVSSAGRLTVNNVGSDAGVTFSKPVTSVQRPAEGHTTSSATPTINTDTTQFYELTAQAVDITSMTTNLSGTPTRGQRLWIAITGTAARTITWGSAYEDGAVALPTTTVTTQRLDVMFIYNSVTSKWRCMASGSA